MIIDVQDELANLVLNACFYLICLITLASVIPWSLIFGKVKWPIYLPLPALVIYIIYEITFPPYWDIRLDLALLIPMMIVIILSSAFRYLSYK